MRPEQVSMSLSARQLNDSTLCGFSLGVNLQDPTRQNATRASSRVWNRNSGYRTAIYSNECLITLTSRASREETKQALRREQHANARHLRKRHSKARPNAMQERWTLMTTSNMRTADTAM
eukprot:1787862-Rhodomonas_salina.3